MICHLSFREVRQDFSGDQMTPTYINPMTEVNQTCQRVPGEDTIRPVYLSRRPDNSAL